MWCAPSRPTTRRRCVRWRARHRTHLRRALDKFYGFYGQGGDSSFSERLWGRPYHNTDAHPYGLAVQFALEDVAEVGRTPAGGIVPATRGAIEQVVSAGDVIEGAETARPIRHGVDLRHAAEESLALLFEILVDEQHPGSHDWRGSACAT